MKVLLTTLNARYTHSSLALAYLLESCRDGRWMLECLEFTINDRTDRIMADIYRFNPDVLCFSCYIWNIRQILEICRDYKKAAPDCIVILGGPEVDFNQVEILKYNQAVDIVVNGEGEYTLFELLDSLDSSGDFTNIDGITFRYNDKIIQNDRAGLINDLSMIKTPYYGDMSYYDHKLVYYETSRGCPFNCSYCLSSTIKGVRYFPLERVKKDLSFLIEQGVKKIKFVDRTFNCNEKRSLEIMKFILEKIGDNKNTSFHFEVCADLFSDEFMNFLKNVPPGIFDFEIGVQSTCPETLQAVNRNSDLERLYKNINRIRCCNNIHMHIDLIAGLPLEDYERFGQSFNDVYNLQPEVIQLGFLKLLKGSQIYAQGEDYAYKYQSCAPYQVLSNSSMTYNDIIRLHDIEELIERYYNTGIIKHTLKYIVKNIYSDNAFSFFEQFSSYWRIEELYDRMHRRDSLYVSLFEFIADSCSEYIAICNELIKYDYLLNNHMYRVPAGLKRHKTEEAKHLFNMLLNDQEFLSEYMPEMKGKNLRDIKKYAFMEYLQVHPLEFKEVDCLIPVIFLYDSGSKRCYRSIVLDLYMSGM